ncbi:DUF2798 domain-containing protein [Alteromonas pelagimontana]|uniref:DUF2798 domain-containing protein n=1 Tax=Alteromonas pelagimontana TaxID=1858656 RepID=A0A6M4M958_9ALTE|nr:DUF2798 domain-containing protein [Alteromonas pelagimontana]QJR79702.1 DUF2798 domain-containing protein [Alteromonas pelagimontana]
MKHRVVFAVMISLILTFFMSAWVTFLNVGIIENFFELWMHAWFLAWPAAGIISFVCAPRLHSLAHQLINMNQNE